MLYALYAHSKNHIAATKRRKIETCRLVVYLVSQLHFFEEAVANTLCFETACRLNIPVSITQGIR